MTSFDELIGAEPAAGAERERLHDVHELLLEAGPPPELSPKIEAGPTLAMTLSRARGSGRRRRVGLTAVAAALVALVVGLGISLHGHGKQYASLSLHGTSLAPYASGTLDVLSTTGARPRLRLEAKGLRPRTKPYVVYLVRNGRPVAPCGSFTVPNTNHTVTTVLVSPYPLESSDTWIVTAPSRNGTGPGLTVLKPAT